MHSQKRTPRLHRNRKLHRVVGIACALPLMMASLSGILLNHRDLISGIDLPRSLLPKSYAYQNGNQAAIRGGDGKTFLFGDSGVWKKEGDQWTKFNDGFPKGADRRKVVDLLEYEGTWFAATPYRLYQRTDASWKPLALPTSSRIIDLFLSGNGLAVLTRSELFETIDGQHFTPIKIPPPKNYRAESSLFTVLWLLHSGELFGTAGRLVVDGLGLLLILLCLTGITHLILPKRMKKYGATEKRKRRFKRHHRLHLYGGWACGGLLCITVATGMFLRPPLLIPIAGKRVPNVRFTTLDDPNPWHDLLRKGVWHEASNAYLLSTRKGFFLFDPRNENVQSLSHQPPVSVMGCTVLKSLDPATYLVGSFSGLYVWNTSTGHVFDFFSRAPVQRKHGKPISDNMISGLIETPKEWVLCDYRNGLRPVSQTAPIQLPVAIEQEGKISLWNLCQELHTGRILRPLLGPFYILFVPLLGLAGLLILITGIIRYLAPKKKVRPRPPKETSPF